MFSCQEIYGSALIPSCQDAEDNCFPICCISACPLLPACQLANIIQPVLTMRMRLRFQARLRATKSCLSSRQLTHQDPVRRLLTALLALGIQRWLSRPETPGGTRAPPPPPPPGASLHSVLSLPRIYVTVVHVPNTTTFTIPTYLLLLNAATYILNATSDEFK